MSRNMADEEGLPPEAIPPDIAFKCHNKQKCGTVVCVLCDEAFHKSDFNKKKGGRYLSGVSVICSDHEDVHITSTSAEPRVVLAYLKKVIEEKNKLLNTQQSKYNNLVAEYNSLKVKYEGLLKEKSNDNKMELDDSTNAHDQNIDIHTMLASVKVENELLTTLNIELTDKNLRLTELLEKERELYKLKKGTYADITANKNYNTNMNIKNHNVPKIIVKRKNENDKSNMEENIIKQIIKDKGIQTKKIIKGKKDTVIIDCMNVESAKSAERTLNSNLSYIYNIEKEKPKNPIIKIVGITGINITDPEIIEKDINKRNFSNSNAKAKIVHYYKNQRNNSYTVLIEITAEMHKQVKENRDRIFVAHLCCRTYDVINVKPCFNCGRVGHSATKCPNPVVCLKCAGKHKTFSCDNANKDECVNCRYSNDKYGTRYKTDHVAVDSTQCEILKTKIRKFITSTSYEVTPTIPRFLGKVGNHKKKQREVNIISNLTTSKAINVSSVSLASSTRDSV